MSAKALSTGLAGGCGMVCAFWVIAALGIGDRIGSETFGVLLSLVPAVGMLSLLAVSAYAGGLREGSATLLLVGVGYVLGVNVGLILNPLYFFPNYGLGAQLYQRGVGLLVAIPLFTMAILLLMEGAVKGRGTFKLSGFEVWMVAFFVAVNFESLMNGLLRQNFVPLVASDVAKDLLIPAGWLVCRRALEIATPWRIFLLVVGFASIPPLIDLGFHIRDLMLGTYERYGGYATLPLAFFAFALLIGGIRRTGLWVTGLGVMLISSVLSMSRIMWFQALVICLFGPWMGRVSIKRRLRASVIAVGLSVLVVSGLFRFTDLGGVVIARGAELFSGGRVGGAWTAEFGGVSGSRKALEFGSVVSRLWEGSLLDWSLGYGAGSEYEFLDLNPEIEKIWEFRELKAHNVHNIFLGVVFRKGALGLIIVGGFLVGFWRALRRVKGAWMRLDARTRIMVSTIEMYFVLSLFKSLSVDVLLWPLEWGVLVAIIGVLLSGEAMGGRPDSPPKLRW